MKFRTSLLSACTRNVNAGFVASLILAISACSDGDSAPAPTAPAETTESSGIVKLRAVWSTEALEKPVTDIALSGGLKPILAVAYNRSGLQLFDLEADKLAKSAPYAIKELAAGYPATIGGADLTIFPGINSDGNLMGYVFGTGLVAPVEVDLNIGEKTKVAGLCSAPAERASDGLFRLGYWTAATDLFVHTGRLVEVNGEFAWLPDGPATQVPSALKACSLVDDGVTASSGNIIDSAHIKRDGFDALIMLSDSGAISALSSSGKLQRLLIDNGISVRMPEEPVAIAALGTPLAGGYGGGLIIAAGDEDGEQIAVFIAADNLTGASAIDE